MLKHLSLYRQVGRKRMLNATSDARNVQKSNGPINVGMPHSYLLHNHTKLVFLLIYEESHRWREANILISQNMFMFTSRKHVFLSHNRFIRIKGQAFLFLFFFFFFRTFQKTEILIVRYCVMLDVRNLEMTFRNPTKSK